MFEEMAAFDPRPPPSSPSTTWRPGCLAAGQRQRARAVGEALTSGEKLRVLPSTGARRRFRRRVAKTRALRDGDDYLITGSKAFISAQAAPTCWS